MKSHVFLPRWHKRQVYLDSTKPSKEISTTSKCDFAATWSWHLLWKCNFAWTNTLASWRHLVVISEATRGKTRARVFKVKLACGSQERTKAQVAFAICHAQDQPVNLLHVYCSGLCRFQFTKCDFGCSFVVHTFDCAIREPLRSWANICLDVESTVLL